MEFNETKIAHCDLLAVATIILRFSISPSILKRELSIVTKNIEYIFQSIKYLNNF